MYCLDGELWIYRIQEHLCDCTDKSTGNNNDIKSKFNIIIGMGMQSKQNWNYVYALKEHTNMHRENPHRQ